MRTIGGALMRALYGAIFLVGVPGLLIVWTRATSGTVTLPPLRSPVAGAVLIAGGLALLASGAHGLISRGRGLPMNAFPPTVLVQEGIYRYLSNPMYLGFGLFCFGISIALGSAAGLWLVSPTACLAAAALVFGFERHDLRSRFGEDATRPPLLSIPGGDGHSPSTWQRAGVYLWILIPWLIAYYGVQHLGRAADAFTTILPFERGWPVVEWTEAVYASAYVFVPITPLLIRTLRDLRRFAVMGAVATFVVTLIWVSVPAVVPHVPHEPATALGRLLEWERDSTTGVASLPAFHVLWTLIACESWSANARRSGRRAWVLTGSVWATAITISCLTTRMHTVLDIVAAVLVFLPLRRYEALWQAVRGLTERVANSWHEWRLGPVRVISHGIWAAAGAGVGLLVAGILAGPDLYGAVTWISICVLVGAGLWAQAIEGSSKLLRPFGWYGGLMGGVLGVAAAAAFGAPVILLLTVFAVAAPWIQILGRIRCLVQGCCHGGPAADDTGIRYVHPRSRVTQLSDLAGRPIHATPLYSIAGNIVIGVLLLRLWSLSAPPALVLGTYLILSAVARFVEESYRAEPQTPIIAGLRLYQWLAAATLLAGILCTTLQATSPAARFHSPGLGLVAAATGIAVVAGFAMGVDFPRSTRRFSRLASAD